LLSIYCKNINKTIVTVAVFLEWFHNCFVWEIEEHFQEQCVKLNAPVVLDNASVTQGVLNLFIPLLNWCSCPPPPHLSFSHMIRYRNMRHIFNKICSKAMVADLEL
jgi:hypothetical protein